MTLPSELYDNRTGERKYLNAEERKAFLAATQLEEAKVKYYCQFLYYTGCRLSEALEICADRFDFKQKGVMIRTLKQGKDENGQDKERFRFNELPEGYLFELQGIYKILQMRGTEKGRKPLWPYTDRTARTYITRIMQKAGITGKMATARGLRHSMGVNLAINKVPINTIQKVLGHAYIKNTMIYTDIVESERRNMIASVW